MRTVVRADGVCVANVPLDRATTFFEQFLFELSHDCDVDVAFTSACRHVDSISPLLVGAYGGFARAHAAVWARGIAARLVRSPKASIPEQLRFVETGAPRGVGLELAAKLDQFRWDSERNEATDMAKLGGAVRDSGPVESSRERRVMAELSDKARVVRHQPLRHAHPYALEVWIGPPTLGAFVAPDTFPERMLPPSHSGHFLSIAFTSPYLEAAQTQSIWLPPNGPTERATFSFEIAHGVERFEARVTVLHENRVVQTLLITASAGVGDLEKPLRLDLEGVVRRDLDDLGGRRPFDAALLFNAMGPGPTMTVFKDGDASLVKSDRIKTALEALSTAIEDATHRPKLHGTPDKKQTTKLLASLARQGTALREALLEMPEVKDSLAGARRLQIVAAAGESVLPLELCYDPEAPREHATMCKAWKQALADGACQPGCPESKRDTVCPVGFWGTSRTIERHVYSKDSAKLVGEHDFAVLQREPTGGRRVPLGARSLCAAADKARSVDATGVDEAFAAAAAAVGLPGVSNEVRSWGEWRAAIAASPPSLLVLLPHTEIKDQLQAMVIAASDIALLTDFGADMVGSIGPVVMLFGCSTATQDGFQAFTSKFRRAGAPIVFGTLCKILGRHAAPLAERLITKMHAANTAPEPMPLGELMTKLRRDMLAEGYPTIFAITAFGDADWMI